MVNNDINIEDNWILTEIPHPKKINTYKYQCIQNTISAQYQYIQNSKFKSVSTLKYHYQCIQNTIHKISAHISAHTSLQSKFKIQKCHHIKVSMHSKFNMQKYQFNTFKNINIFEIQYTQISTHSKYQYHLQKY